MTNPSAAATACWYADARNRPRIGSCPQACNGPPAYAERVADGRLRAYCDVHAAWRRSSIRLPTLVFAA